MVSPPACHAILIPHWAWSVKDGIFSNPTVRQKYGTTSILLWSDETEQSIDIVGSSRSMNNAECPVSMDCKESGWYSLQFYSCLSSPVYSVFRLWYLWDILRTIQPYLSISLCHTNDVINWPAPCRADPADCTLPLRRSVCCRLFSWMICLFRDNAIQYLYWCNGQHQGLRNTFLVMYRHEFLSGPNRVSTWKSLKIIQRRITSWRPLSWMLFISSITCLWNMINIDKTAAGRCAYTGWLDWWRIWFDCSEREGGIGVSDTNVWVSVTMALAWTGTRRGVEVINVLFWLIMINLSILFLLWFYHFA